MKPKLLISRAVNGPIERNNLNLNNSTTIDGSCKEKVKTVIPQSFLNNLKSLSTKHGPLHKTRETRVQIT